MLIVEMLATWSSIIVPVVVSQQSTYANCTLATGTRNDRSCDHSGAILLSQRVLASHWLETLDSQRKRCLYGSLHSSSGRRWRTSADPDRRTLSPENAQHMLYNPYDAFGRYSRGIW